MSLTKFVQNIVPELREAISDPAHILTAAERFTLWEILAQVKASVAERSVEESARILPPTLSEREHMLLRRLHEHMEIMRDWVRYLRSAPDLMEARRLADRIDDYAEADHRWMAERDHEASS